MTPRPVPDVAGRDLLPAVAYGVCSCSVWPIVAFERVGRCGSCDGEITDRFDSAEEALAAFPDRRDRRPT